MSDSSCDDIRLIARKPVGAGALKAVQVQRAFAVERLDLVHQLLEGAFKLPTVIRRVANSGAK